MGEATITNSIEERPSGSRLSSRLVFVANADDPSAVSSLHSLDDIDEVRFHRSTRSVERAITDAGRTLTLSFPDGRMSSSHGCLKRQDTRWLLDDPASKNGSIVDGAITRRAVLTDGTVFELGRSFFVFRQTVVERDPPAYLARDVDAAQLPASPGMATFLPSLAANFEDLTRLAPSSVSIVLRGETGTGKEVVARAIHTLSQRTGAFVAVNCGALPPSLVEAELFGHRRGAFSGAVADRRGLIRSADHGTLFLDEIGELPAASQAALLRVLQEREVLPVGEDRPVAVDLRVVAATLRDLEAAIAESRFRADLYARLVGHVIELPALRDRREDLGLLIGVMVPRIAKRSVRFATAALRALLLHDWPLNIRELEQVLTTSIALATGDVIELDHLPASLRVARVASPPAIPALDPEDQELRTRLVELFTTHDGNVVAVAEALGKQRTQIYKWIKRLAIDLSAFRRNP